MRPGKGYSEGAVEKGGDANVAERKTLTEKQKLFCRFCAEGASPKEAAKLAGYSNAGATAKRMIRMAKIQKYIEKLKNPTKERNAEAETAVASSIISKAGTIRKIS